MCRARGSSRARTARRMTSTASVATMPKIVAFTPNYVAATRLNTTGPNWRAAVNGAADISASRTASALLSPYEVGSIACVHSTGTITNAATALLRATSVNVRNTRAKASLPPQTNARPRHCFSSLPCNTSNRHEFVLRGHELLLTTVAAGQRHTSTPRRNTQSVCREPARHQHGDPGPTVVRYDEAGRSPRRCSVLNGYRRPGPNALLLRVFRSGSPVFCLHVHQIAAASVAIRIADVIPFLDFMTSPNICIASQLIFRG